MSRPERPGSEPGTGTAAPSVRAGFDPAMAGRRAECDGGSAVPGTRYAGREEFSGVLTGRYVDHGDPPWRWYLMVDLDRKPEGYRSEAVWCESGSLFPSDEPGGADPRAREADGCGSSSA